MQIAFGISLRGSNTFTTQGNSSTRAPESNYKTLKREFGHLRVGQTGYRSNRSTGEYIEVTKTGLRTFIHSTSGFWSTVKRKITPNGTKHIRTDYGR
jgi:hypothetical protein